MINVLEPALITTHNADSKAHVLFVGYEEAFRFCWNLNELFTDFHRVEETGELKCQFVVKLTSATLEKLNKFLISAYLDPKVVLSEDILIKAVRGDYGDFFRDIFLQTITRSPIQQIKYPLRGGPVEEFTVTGKNIYQRPKNPQYTQEEKRYHSQPQSTSLVTAKHQSRLFGYNKPRNKKIVGFATTVQDTLFTERFMKYDGATYERGYNHKDFDKAKAYFDEKVKSNKPVLFGDYQSFKAALANYPTKKYNEVLARIRWNKDHSFLLIGSDTLEARLIAQERARLLAIRLAEQEQEFRNNYQVNDAYATHLLMKQDPNYTPPIIFYLPENPKHLSVYTAIDAAKDRAEGLKLYYDDKKIIQKYSLNDYECLLAITNTDKLLEETVGTGYSQESLILRIIRKGHAHIAAAILDKASDKLKASVLLRCHTTNIAEQTAAIYHAIKKNDANMVAWLLSKGMPYDDESVALNNEKIKNPQIERLLHQSIHYYIPTRPIIQFAKKNDLSGLTALLNGPEPVDLNLRDVDERTPLINAIIAGNFGIAFKLLDAGANPDLLDKESKSALYHLLKKIQLQKPGAKEFFNRILKSNVDLNVVNSYNESIIYHAISLSLDIECIEDLVKAGANIYVNDEQGETTLMRAIRMDDYPIIRFLLDKIIADKQLKFLAATDHSKLNAINFLMLCSKTSEENRDALIEELLECGLNPNSQTASGNGYLHIAIALGDLGMVETFFAGFDADQTNQTLEKLNLNLQNYVGETPLILAIKHYDEEIFEYLIDQDGIDYNIKNNQGEHALKIALKTTDILINHIEHLASKTNLDLREDQALFEKLYQIAQEQNSETLLEFLAAKGFIAAPVPRFG